MTSGRFVRTESDVDLREDRQTRSVIVRQEGRSVVGAGGAARHRRAGRRVSKRAPRNLGHRRSTRPRLPQSGCYRCSTIPFGQEARREPDLAGCDRRRDRAPLRSVAFRWVRRDGPSLVPPVSSDQSRRGAPQPVTPV
jgi:hypothetical protein